MKVETFFLRHDASKSCAVIECTVVKKKPVVLHVGFPKGNVISLSDVRAALAVTEAAFNGLLS